MRVSKSVAKVMQQYIYRHSILFFSTSNSSRCTNFLEDPRDSQWNDVTVFSDIMDELHGQKNLLTYGTNDSRYHHIRHVSLDKCRIKLTVEDKQMEPCCGRLQESMTAVIEIVRYGL